MFYSEKFDLCIFSLVSLMKNTANQLFLSKCVDNWTFYPFLLIKLVHFFSDQTLCGKWLKRWPHTRDFQFLLHNAIIATTTVHCTFYISAMVTLLYCCEVWKKRVLLYFIQKDEYVTTYVLYLFSKNSYTWMHKSVLIQCNVFIFWCQHYFYTKHGVLYAQITV